MKSRSLMKSALLVGLGVCSWFCTTALIAQSKRGKAGSALPYPVAATKFKKGSEPRQAVGLVTRPVNITGSGQLDEMTVTPVAGGVAVEAKATMEATRKGESFLWSVLIKDKENDNLVSYRDDSNQVFSLPLGVVTALSAT